MLDKLPGAEGVGKSRIPGFYTLHWLGISRYLSGVEYATGKSGKSRLSSYIRQVYRVAGERRRFLYPVGTSILGARLRAGPNFQDLGQ